MTRYYQLTDNKMIPGRWYLGPPFSEDGSEIDPRLFTIGRQDNPRPSRIGIRRPGRPLEFTEADFGMPVIATSFADRLRPLVGPAVQFIEILIDGNGGYAIMNVLPIVNCIDDDQSQVARWTREDHRADLAGQYRVVLNLTIDPARAGSNKIFRTEGWVIALIVSEEVKDVLDTAMGAQFIPA